MSDDKLLEDTEKHGPVIAAILDVWGERCPEFEPECYTCKAWADYDRIRSKALEEAARVAARIYQRGQIGKDIAAAIRALKTKEQA